MIISASYKTDIPAFYARWFVNLLRAGFCQTINPYNQNVQTISLSPVDVQAYVFWSRNYQPFLDMGVLEELGKPFVCQMTILNYPRWLEVSTIAADKALDQVRHLSGRFGPKAVVWRYDPIVVNERLTVDWHLENFAVLARQLAGHVDEVVVSFLQVYQKTKRNFMAQEIDFPDMRREEKQNLLRALHQIAQSHQMTLTLCAQPDLLIDPVQASACIDVQRLESLSGRGVMVSKKPHRAECGCAASRDIGEYDTCPHGCFYCYAVQRQDLAKQRYQAHDPDSPFLFSPEGGEMPEDPQGSLF
ncbi:DUF1848 domain-containing protein [Terasakiella pusilla]|uniref:DUF1848 domain-containing protein n=1 Tax=Terasakiella pusilla TaxID=64973 RepID=UPI000491B999|nr:DUF1848 domain-containing protein [Terasakiella pusilla]